MSKKTFSGELSRADARRFQRSILDLTKLTGKPMEQVMKDQGRLFAVDAAKYTERYGTSKDTYKKQVRDIKRSINAVYLKPLQIKKFIAVRAGRKTANRFARYARQDAAKAQGLINEILPNYGGRRLEIGAFDGGNRHTRMLSGRGKSSLVVTNYKDTVPAYTKRKIKNVGEAKSGWAKAAAMLGTPVKLPVWITKGHKSRGYGSVKGRKSKAVLTVSNHSPYGLSKTKISTVWRVQMGKMEKLVERMIKNKGRKIVRKV